MKTSRNKTTETQARVAAKRRREDEEGLAQEVPAENQATVADGEAGSADAEGEGLLVGAALGLVAIAGLAAAADEGAGPPLAAPSLPERLIPEVRPPAQVKPPVPVPVPETDQAPPVTPVEPAIAREVDTKVGSGGGASIREEMIPPPEVTPQVLPEAPGPVTPLEIRPEAKLVPEPKPQPEPEPEPEPPGAPTLLPPTLKLNSDSGVDGDGLTNDTLVLVTDLTHPTWVFSVDEGKEWREGRPDGAILPDEFGREDGPKAVLVKQQAADGRFSPEARLDFIFDGTAPDQPKVEVRPSTLSDRDTGERTAGEVRLRATEPGTTLHWETVDDQRSDKGSTGELRLPGDLVATSDKVLYWQEDAAGNRRASVQMAVDVIPPGWLNLVPVHPAEDSDPADGADPVVRMHGGALRLAELEAGGSWSYSIDGAAWQTRTQAVLSDPRLEEPGKHVIRLVHIDAQGNESDVQHQQVEVAGRLRLKLKNDTGILPEQTSDLYTSDATVEVEGIGSLQGQVEYRIDGGQWWPLGDGRVVGNSQFPGDGKKHVEVRPLDADGGPLASVSLAFEVDRTPPELKELRVVHPRDSVRNKGTNSASVDGYTLTNIAEVELIGFEEGATYNAHRYNTSMTWQIPKSHVLGTTAFLPKQMFQEGPQTIGAMMSDRAGNRDQTIQMNNILLDTTPPATPAFTKVDTQEGLDILSPRRLEVGGYLEYRDDANAGWIRVAAGGEIPGPSEIRQVDEAGNPSLESHWLNANQRVSIPMPGLADSVL